MKPQAKSKKNLSTMEVWVMKIFENILQCKMNVPAKIEQKHFVRKELKKKKKKKKLWKNFCPLTSFLKHTNLKV